MFGRQKLKDEIVRLNYRVAELEERLCPMNAHDWVKVSSTLVTFTKGIDWDSKCTYRCRRCGKTRVSIE